MGVGAKDGSARLDISAGMLALTAVRALGPGEERGGKAA